MADSKSNLRPKASKPNLKSKSEEDHSTQETHTEDEHLPTPSRPRGTSFQSGISTGTPQKSILINRNLSQHFKDALKNVQAPLKVIQIDSGDGQLTSGEGFIYMTIPPDGGYGWFILVMAFLCQVIVDGVIFSIGILLPYIATELSMSYTQTALIASTQIAPLSSALINKFGFRPVAMFGAVVASISFFIASFTQGTTMLVIFYGVIAGPAMGMIWISTSLIVNYYFENYRALVGGIVSSGSGVGVMLITLLNVHAAAAIGWRNTIRIHVILLLMAGLIALSYKEVTPRKIGQFVEDVLEEDSEGSANSVEISVDLFSLGPPEAEKSMSSVTSETRNITKRLVSIIDLDTEGKNKWFLDYICPCFARRKSSAGFEGKGYLISHRPLDRDDIFYDGHPDFVRTLSPIISGPLAIEMPSGKGSRSIHYSLSMVRPPSQAFMEERARVPFDFREAFSTLFDFRLLRVSEFRLLLCVAFFFPLGFNIPYMYSVSRAEIPKERAVLIPLVIGLTNIVFRIFVGFMAYRIEVHTAYLSGAGMLLGGMVTLLSGFVGADSEVFQFVFAVCFSLGAASNGALRAIIYVKVVGLERLTNAFGLTTMMTGVGAFLGTNIAGLMNDLFDGYWMAFIFSGVAMTIAGLFNLSIPRYVERQKMLEAKRVQKKVRFTGVNSRAKWWRKVSQSL